MGYTHYWRRPVELEADTFAEFTRDVAKLLLWAKANNLPIVGGNGTPGTAPEITDETVCFNGLDAYETFCVYRAFQGHLRKVQFEFCKTGRRPYDIVVCASLIALKFRFGDEVEVSSDGDQQEWAAAFDLAEKLLGYTAEFVGDVGNRTLEVI